MPVLTELDRGRQAVPQLYELLRDKIVALELAPGEPLSRVRLSAQFKVSQTPMREALQKLADEKLVDVFPQAATRVSLIDISYAQETHFLRRAIELEIARELALHPPAQLIGQLETLLARQEALRDANDFARFTETDQAFHWTMYQLSGKETLWRLVRSRSGHIDRLRRLHLPVAGKLERIVADHRRLLNALRDGDPAAAQDSLRAHLSGTLESAEEIRQQHPQFFTEN